MVEKKLVEVTVMMPVTFEVYAWKSDDGDLEIDKDSFREVSLAHDPGDISEAIFNDDDATEELYKAVGIE